MTPANQPTTRKQNLRAMQILCAALMIGVLIFAVMAILLNKVNGPLLEPEGLKQTGDIFRFAPIGLAVICFFISNTMYRRLVMNVKNTHGTLTDKLISYRAALITGIAPLEGAGLFGGVAFLLTGDIVPLTVSAAMAGLIFLKYPTRKKLVQELELDWNSDQELD